MTTNPERLWCLRDCEDGAGFVFAWGTEERASYGFAFGKRKPTTEYIRADVAAATCREKLRHEALHTGEQREWATVHRNEAAALRAERDTARHERDRLQADVERLRLLLGEARDETATAERQREALRAEVEALRSHLGCVLRMFKDETSGGDGMREEHVADYEAAKAALAAKGVG